MPVDHYENFPVASILIPARLRRATETIYRFARAADDIADEGFAPADERLAILDAFAAQIERIGAGLAPQPQTEPHLFEALRQTMSDHQLASEPFLDLLSAFRQDVCIKSYADYAQLLDYCRRSANPVGRLVLCLYGKSEPDAIALSDRICTSLQLINFWQDLAIDRGRGRIYIPQEDLRAFSVEPADLDREEAHPALRDLIRFQVNRTRDLMQSGAPLVHRLRGRIALELRMVVQGGLRILEKIEWQDCDVLARRPVLDRSDWIVIAARAIRMRAP